MTRSFLGGIAAISLSIIVLAGCGSASDGAGSASGTATGAVDAPNGGQAADAGEAGSGQVADANQAGTHNPSAGGLCLILSSARAAQALGEPVDGGTADESVEFNNASCRYNATGSTATLKITYHPSNDRDTWEAQMAKVGMTDEWLVTGLGDAAYLNDHPAGAPGAKLAAFDTDHDLWVVITKVGDQTAINAAAESLARELLETLD